MSTAACNTRRAHSRLCRSLELLQLLDQKWSNMDAGLSVYPLVYLNNCAFSTLKCTRTLTQFMSDAMQNLAQSSPFPLNMVQSTHTLDELKGMQGPKVRLRNTHTCALRNTMTFHAMMVLIC